MKKNRRGPLAASNQPFAGGTLFARFFHASPVAMTLTRLTDSIYVDVNDAYVRLVGSGREELVGRPNLEWVGSRPAENAPAQPGRSPVATNTRLRTAQGELHHVITTSQVEEWEGETYLLTMIQDLTDYKLAESALRASQTRFRLFFESMPLPVFVFDRETLRVIDVNAAVVEQYGYTRQELLSLTMLDIRPAIEHAKFRDQVPHMPNEIEPLGIWLHQRKDGTIRQMEVTGYALQMEDRTMRLAVCQDVTEQQAVEAALRASEERHRIITEVTNDVLWEMDGRTQRVSFSEGLQAVFGHKLSSSVSLDWWEEHIHPEDREEISRDFQEAEAGLEAEWSATYRFQRKDGSFAHVLDRGRFFRDSTGKAVRSFGAIVDITRQVEMQEAATRAAMEERRRLARDLHDSVTQSLYSLSLMAEAARRHARQGDRQATNEYVDRLGELAQHSLREMRLLVHEMRPSLLEKEGLAEALQARLDTVERHSGIRAKLVVNIEQDLPSQVQLQYYRIVEEALNNALKHAGASSVRVTIHAAADVATVEIADNGRGFDLAAASASGGLGLTSIRERMEHLGGSAVIESTPGKGTTIRVKSPIGGQ
ncbi:MAG: PAS domain S-box protein [Candidatus Promineofilum sp.]|nr:PAS domain S-box protein [Promineifilum sp.]